MRNFEDIQKTIKTIKLKNCKYMPKVNNLKDLEKEIEKAFNGCKYLPNLQDTRLALLNELNGILNAAAEKRLINKNTSFNVRQHEYAVFIEVLYKGRKIIFNKPAHNLEEFIQILAELNDDNVAYLDDLSERDTKEKSRVIISFELK